MLNLRKAMFNRMFRGKDRIPYKIKIKGDRYKILVKVTWKWAFFKGFMDKLSQKTGKTITTPDSFDVDPKAYNHLLNELRPTFNTIRKKESINVPKLAFLSAKVNSGKFVRDGENITLYIVVTGICKYDV